MAFGDIHALGAVIAFYNEWVRPEDGAEFYTLGTVTGTTPAILTTANGISYYNIGSVYAEEFSSVHTEEFPDDDDVDA